MTQIFFALFLAVQTPTGDEIAVLDTGMTESDCLAVAAEWRATGGMGVVWCQPDAAS